MIERLRNVWQVVSRNSNFILAFFLAIIFTTLAILNTLANEPSLKVMKLVVVVTVWFLAVSSWVGVWLYWQKKTEIGAWVIIIAFWMGILVLSFVTIGSGVIFGIAAFIVAAAFSVNAFPVRQTNQVMAIGVLVGGAAFIQDIYGATDRLVLLPKQHSLTIIVIALILSIFWLDLFLQFRKLSLLSKLLVPIVIITISTIGVLSIYNYRVTRQALLDTKNQALRATAQQIATAINAYIESARTSLITEARLPEFRKYMSLPEGERRGSEEEINALALLRLLQTKGYILSYSLLDNTGRVWLSTSVPPEQVDQLPRNLGIDLTDRGYLNLLLLTGEPYISPVIFLPDGNPSIFLATRIDDQEGNAIGVLVSQYHASNLQAIVARSNNLAGPGSFAVLVDENNFRLAQGLEPQALYRFVTPPGRELFSDLVSAYRIPDLPIEQVATNYPSFEAGLRNASAIAFFAAQEAGTQDQVSSVAVVRLPDRKWSLAFIQPQAAFLQPVEQQSRTAILLATGIAVLVSFAVGMVARFIVQPIVRLTHIAQLITSGDLSIQAPVRSQDEIGTLSEAFNVMTSQLRQILEGLEQRVRERTQELEKITDQMRHRANQLQTVSEVARAIASVQDIDVLLPRITQMISERFGFYHVGIFLLDPHREYAVLRAANSEGGKRMLARGHRLKVGQVGIVGYVTSRGEPRIALDVGQDAVYFDNPDLPETRSEMALPLRVGEIVIGALDVQSKTPSAFKEEDISLLTTLADQVAIAIENSRLFGETQQALIEVQTAQREYLRSEWEKVSTQQDLKGFQYTYGRVTSLDQPGDGFSWTEFEQQEADLREGVPVKPSRGGEEFSLSQSAPEMVEDELVIPITLRGQLIGIIKLQDIDQTRTWDQEEISLIKSVADQIGLALENARLLETTQRRAEREYLVGQITTRMRASNDPQVILQTAVSELRKVLHARKAQVIIQGKPTEDTDQNKGSDQLKP